MPEPLVVRHPIAAHLLAVLRDRTTGTAAFRAAARDLGMIVGYEALRDLPLTSRRIDTPLEPFDAPSLAAPAPCIVPILRAGLAIAEGLGRLLPDAAIGHIGLARDEATLRPATYYAKLPPDIAKRETILADPMLATGGSAIAAMQLLRAAGARRVRFVCLLAAPEGLAAIDRCLDSRGYILPGLGDAGDRFHDV
jgi:uracil phosphoribosyltransferase